MAKTGWRGVHVLANAVDPMNEVGEHPAVPSCALLSSLQALLPPGALSHL